MRKFTDLSSNKNNKETVKTTRQLIESVIDETLDIKDGNIDGKTTLVDVLEKMFNMNSIKTSIKVLENVKSLTYKGLDIKMLNEAIDYHKNMLGSDVVDVTDIDELTKLSEMCSTIINESKKEELKDDEDDDEDKYKENLKKKVINYLIKSGNNDEDVKKMVDKHFDEAATTLRTVKKISEYIRSSY